MDWLGWLTFGFVASAVLTAIQEIIINLVGSEELAVFELSVDGNELQLVVRTGGERPLVSRQGLVMPLLVCLLLLPAGSPRGEEPANAGRSCEESENPRPRLAAGARTGRRDRRRRMRWWNMGWTSGLA